MIKSNANRVLVTIGVLGILYTIVVVLRRSILNLGTYLPGIIGIFILLYVVFKGTNLYGDYKNIIHIIEKGIIGLFIVWLISFVCISSIIVISSISSDKGAKPDCMVVLGAGLRGRVPSLVLTERLNSAIKYIKSNPNIKIIVSGGRGFGEEISEASAMEMYLIDHGVRASSILKEEKSTSTIQNLKFSKAIYEGNTHHILKKIMIVTSDFHMFRAKFLARRLGLKPYGISSKTPFYLYPSVFIREYFAVIKSFIFDKV